MDNKENFQDLLLYQSENKNLFVEVLYDNENFWITQQSKSDLFNVAENNITYHLKNIFAEKELEEKRTTQKIRVVQLEGDELLLETKALNKEAEVNE